VPLACFGTVRGLVALDRSRERVPGVSAEREHRPLAVGGVAHGYATGVGYFDALTAGTA
jgi:hypothetical protein